jgi:acyl transferase domain-containing protein/NAD(P)-dependent dehydrogenase (short-subunit alcohol dehydrogenase family)/acyl carrier protein
LGARFSVLDIWEEVEMSRSPRDPAERAIAVIGVGAILPDALDAKAFWQNVVTGRDSISEVTLDRWALADYYDPDPKAPGKTYSKIGGWVRGVSFEPTKYRIPPTVSAAMDDGQKWALLCAGEALRDAGHPDRPLDTESTAVILGNAMGGELHYLTCLRLSMPEYVHAIADTQVFQSLPPADRAALVAQLRESVGRRFPDTTEDTMPGELTNITSGRVAAVLNLRGPNFTADAACASSLAALQAAVDGLVDHHYDVVVTGAMDRNMGATTFIKFCKIGALSPDGSRPYDKDASGFIMGEGGAFFVCKRLEDAEQAGDRIYAVIRGVGGSSDGKGRSIIAPNPLGQILALRRAWQRAGLDPATMTLLEGHGTSTRAGDVAEMETVTKLLSEGSPIKHRIALGSIKSQIGHLKSAAGAAGLLKAVLACHHKILPPSINFNQPNPSIPWDKMPLYVNTKAQPWEKPSFGPRRCGLSAFGFGGTNFHVVVEEHVPGMLTRRESMVQVPASFPGPGVTPARDTRPPMLGNMLAVGGADAGGVRTALIQAMESAKAGQVPDRRPPGPDFLAAPARMVIAFEDAADLVKKCETALAGLDKDEPRKWRVLQSKGIHFRRGGAGKVAFLFPGQGSQYVNMLADVPDPIVRETFAEADRVMGPILGQPLTSYVYKNEADPAAMQAAEEALKDTTICQPAMVATDIAVMRLLDKHGVVPDIVMGHSLGEWAAAVGAGMVTFPEALVAVSARARAMASVSIGDKGKMASVMGPTDEIVRRLPEIGGYLTPANINSRKQTVIAGASDAVDRAVDYFNKLGMIAQLIPVSHAFHSKVVAPASDALYRTICEMQIAFPRIPLVGNIDGQLYPTHDMDTIRRRLADQMASSVQFVKGIETCYREGARIFVEIGPKRALMALAESILEDKDDVICLATNHPKRGGIRSFHDAMCGFYAAGIPRPENLLAALAATRPDPETAVATSAAVAAAASPIFSQGATQTMSESPIRASAGQPDYDGLGRLFARFLDEGMALYGGRRAGPPALPETLPGSIVISGAALGLPGQNKHVFDDSNVERILRGDSFIDSVPQVFRTRMVEKNVVRLVKREVGEPSLDPIRSVDEVIRLAGRRGVFDAVEEFGIPRERVEAWDITSALAIAAGIEALRDAGIPLVRHYRRTTTGGYLPDRWRLPVAMADETGVIFASAFPGYDNLVDEVTRFFTQRTGDASYEFDRRFLFRVLSMGHAQFAELLGIRGPNTQVNAACASTTMAVGMAEDWIRAGRCRRVLVIGADDVTSDNLLEWMGAGFLASGAATTEDVLEKAALPFDRRRNGMLLGMGACGLVVESEDSLRERGMRGLCEVLGSEFANSAFHGTRLDVDHIEGVMERLVSGVERRHGIDRHAMARELVFISHETYTPARGGSASAEVFALRKTFGASTNALVVCNTKGFTGHPMGVGVEDAVAVKILEKQIVPPVPNYREPDPELGTLNLSKGGHYPVRYALRLAAGFGSQIAMTMLRRIQGLEERVADRAAYQRWLAEISGYPAPALEVEKRTLRIKDNGPPAREPAQSAWTTGTGPHARVGDGAPTPAAARAQVAPAAGATPAAGPAAAMTAAPSPAVATAPSPAVTTAAVASGGDVVMETVLRLVSDKTGYPRDMLDPELDLEADLGIDTVKQAEVFALVRETFNIPRKDTLKLRDYPTLRRVVGFVRENRPDLAGAPASATVTATATGNVVVEKVLAVLAEKTGYPRDMLELDLDLEADLGIDTVKQAEVFALVRETFNIPRQDTLKLRDYPTLRHVIGFVETNRPDLAGPAAAAAPVSSSAPASVPPFGGFGTDSPPHQPPSAPHSPVAAPALPVGGASVASPPRAPHAPVAALASAPATTTSTTATTAGAAGAGDAIAEKVLELVAGKTGYPRDMLEFDLDLEADLGIDTVKQAEVFALVRETFNIPRQDKLKLREYPTLRHVIGFVNQYLPAAAAPTAPIPAPVEPTAGAPAVDAAPGQSPFVSGLLRRPVVTLRPPLDSCKKTGVRLERGSRVVVVADSEGAGKLLCEQLEGRGVQVLRIDARPERAEIEAALHGWAQTGNVAGLYFLPALDRSAPLSDLDLVQFRKLYRDRVLLLHGAARGLYEALGNPGSFVVAATRMGGQHGYGAAGASNPLGGAVSGFSKTLRRERPDLLAKVVDFEDGASPEMIARALLDETECDPGAVEIGYAGGLRVTIGLEVMQALPADTKPPIKLDENTVFAVTGGAGAITVAIVRDLAAASRGTFYLLDARAMPPESEHALLQTVVKDREAAKREVFERIKAEKGRATPAQVEEKLFDLERQAGILEALRGVEQAGGRAFYRQVDVLDSGAVKTVVDNIRAESGRIDVILHAAGLERSRSLDRKPVEEFDLVFRVKADGLFNLLAATRDMDVKAIVGFSSVAGRFGNAGQADYSSGNDFMCKALSWWAASRPGSLGIALDWTAWGGIGMATRGSVPEIMKRAGIDMLSPAEGLPVIRHALLAGFSGEAVVGHKLGILLAPFDEDGGIDPDGNLLARARARALPLPFDKVSFDLHQGMTAEIRLDPKVEPFLYDHAIDGIPVLPGVMGLEIFAEAAWLLAPLHRVAALENVRFLAPMKYYRHEPRSMIVRARPLLGADGRVRVHTTLSSVQVVVGREPEEKLHFAGVVVLEQGDGPGARTAVDSAGPVGGIGHDDIYRVYFHGPAYRVLEMVNRLSSGKVVGTMRTPLPADTTNPDSTSMVGPRMVELCFQTAGVWEIGQTGQMGLPAVVDRVTVFDPTPNGKLVVAELQPHPSEDALSFDARVRDDEGKVYLTVQGYRTSRIPGGLPDEAVGRFRGVID